MKRIVGIDRKVKRIWADALLDQLAETTKEQDLRSFLDNYLKEDLPSKETRSKAVGIVLKIWGTIPRERESLRQRAIELLPHISGQERIWLHWGMMSLAYPFFRDGIEIVGRLLALQDDFASVQVQGRIVTAWGDRTTIKLAARYLLNTLVDWEVLRPGKKQGHFLLSRKLAPSSSKLSLWLLEALLAASESDEIEAQQLLRLPEAFPFSLKIGIADLRGHEGFNIHRQGLDMDMVAQRKIKLEAPRQPAKNQNRKSKSKVEPRSLFDDEPVSPISSNDVQAGKDADEVKNTRAIEQRSIVGQRISNSPFSGPIKECDVLFRSGYFLGCIALTRTVIEAVVQYAWQVKLKKKAVQKGTFPRNLDALYTKTLISDEVKKGLAQMWNERQSFEGLGYSSDSDSVQIKLETEARKFLNFLNDLQHEFFGFKLREGTVVPHHPEFWEAIKK